MKRSIIHDNNGILRKARQKDLLKPSFKQIGIGRTSILHRRQNFVAHFCGNNIRALEFSARDCAGNRLTAGGVRIFPEKIGIQSGFVDIGNRFYWYILNLI